MTVLGYIATTRMVDPRRYSRQVMLEVGFETPDQPGVLHRDPNCIAAHWTVAVWKGTAHRLHENKAAISFIPAWHDCRPPEPADDWVDDAVCRITVGKDFTHLPLHIQASACLDCPVATQCLQRALQYQRHNHYDHFVAGGLEPPARHRLRSMIRKRGRK